MSTDGLGVDHGDSRRDAFIARYGSIYEHSPWVAAAVFGLPGTETTDGLARMMRAVVDDAGPERLLALLRAHPELACRQVDALTEASQGEQRGAGLDRCTAEEFAEFQRLNAAYRAKFGFPFIVAVKGLDRAGILAQFRQRIEHDSDTEFRTAVQQVHRIAGFRLAALDDARSD